MDMSAFIHANRRGRQPELRTLMARIASLQSVSPTARATMVTPSSDLLTRGSEKTIDQMIVPCPCNLRQQAAPASFNSGVAEALITQAKGS
jgi:hypothetical protein